MKDDQNTTGFYGDKVGICPKCGNDIIKGKYYYGCRDYKNCQFRIPISLCGRVITFNEAKEILDNKTSKELDGFISKKGTNFKAKLKLDENGVSFDFN
jgi:DNA topoisomerase-3